MIRIEHNPTGHQLAVFGLLWLLLFGIMGGTAVCRTGSFVAAGWYWAIGTLIPATGLVLPGILRIFYLLAAYATFPIGLAVSYVILAVVYYLVLTPTGLVMRWKGYDPMQRRFDRNAKSYWSARVENESTERYFRQF
jgi:hypothetical protein